MQILNDELCRLELKDAAAGMATVTLTFQRGSVDDRGVMCGYAISLSSHLFDLILGLQSCIDSGSPTCA